MLKIYVKPKAELDLEQIYLFTFNKFGLTQAEKYQDELFEGMMLIANSPFIGKIYPHSKKEYRKLHVNRHLIFYRHSKESCEIIRVLHDSMDVRMKLL